MKKISKSSFFAIVLTLVIAVSSCKKSSDDATPDPTSVLTSKTWVPTTDAYKPETSDMSLYMAAAIVAAFEPSSYTFQTGGVLKYTGSLSSSESTGTWSLASDNKTLTLKKEDGTILSTVVITEANSTSLKWKKTYKKADLSTTSDVDVTFYFKPKQ